MKPILEIHGIGKRYRIGHQTNTYLSLRERMLDVFRFEKTEKEDFWALDDISFSLGRGESLGIIGRNGAGKSTLLKILSRITPPTKGKILSRGRIASLLEVGTGFHPELTGRENIFFNGSLLGMKRREIESKFDEIVEFSDVEKFLDTPLKHYSSGMQLRLAFSVAAFLEPEILIVDEVLAVGDAEFQRKCLGKMENVANSGRTIIFVSHNLQSLKFLCQQALYIEKGKLKAIGEIEKTIDLYLSDNSSVNSLASYQQNLGSLRQDSDFRLINIVLAQGNRSVIDNVRNGEELKMEIEYELLNNLSRFRVFVDICDQFGTTVLRTYHDEVDYARLSMKKGTYKSILTIPANFLAPVTYEFRFWFGIHNVRMVEPIDGVTFKVNVENSGLYNMTYNGQYSVGLVCPTLHWDIYKN
ncbi:MAG: polysaccharide ABC transporter ATP-binding protein [Chryseolinea sp.]